MEYAWNNKLAKLDDYVEVFPAHGAGSLCGAHLSDEPMTTIGEERQENYYLQMKSKSEFIAAILDGLPEAPQYFGHNAAINKNGPELVNWKAAPKKLTPKKQLLDPDSYYVVDIRETKEYAPMHIPNSVNIGVRGRLETWVGIMVPWGSKVVLTGNEEELKEALFRLHRVGYTAEVVPFDTWKSAKMPMARNTLIKPKELYNWMQSGEAPIIVDVRLPAEWNKLRIGTIVNMQVDKIPELASKLDAKAPVLAVCNSAYRSSMAVGLFERKGFKKVSSLDGGSGAWIEKQYPVYGSDTKDGKPTEEES